MKFCNICQKFKDDNEWYSDKSKKDGLSSYCIECTKNKSKQYRQKNKDMVNKKQNESYFLNKKKRKSQHKSYILTHKEQYNNYQKLYHRERVKNDINFVLRARLRGRLSDALTSNQKIGSAIDHLGCSIDELKQWLEQQFQTGMTWKNYGRGKGKWNIDHIIPLTKVNLQDLIQFKKVNHWFNLRPMWSTENTSRGNRI